MIHNAMIMTVVGVGIALLMWCWEPAGRDVAYVLLRPFLSPIFKLSGGLLNYLKNGPKSSKGRE